MPENIMKIIPGQPTGMVTKYRYLGRDGHYDIFEGQTWKLPDGKIGKVRWNYNKGLWCLMINDKGIKIPLYKITNIISKV